MKQWYVVQTRFRGEGLAKANLQRQGFEAYLPQYLKRRRHARRTNWVPAPLFPGYMFVRLDPETMRWRSIRSTIGVRSLICRGDMPIPLPSGVIKDIMSREDEGGMVALNGGLSFAKGDKVQIMSGAFRDRTGLFDCSTDDERVVILLDLLGRQTRVRLPAEAICAYA